MNSSIKDLGINRFWGEMGEPDLDKLFEKCVRRTFDDEWHNVRCKLSFWSTSGANKELVERTAKNYWRQYFEDGEYDKLLKL